MKRSEILKINNAVDEFLQNQAPHFRGIGLNFTFDEYILSFNRKLKNNLPFMFRGQHNYTDKLIEKYSNNIMSVCQPIDPKNGILSFILQFSLDLHAVLSYGMELRNDQIDVAGSIIFASYAGLDPILDWMKDNSEHINMEIYTDKDNTGLGFMK
jgi:hypothetical protein